MILYLFFVQLISQNRPFPTTFDSSQISDYILYYTFLILILRTNGQMNLCVYIDRVVNIRLINIKMGFICVSSCVCVFLINILIIVAESAGCYVMSKSRAKWCSLFMSTIITWIRAYLHTCGGVNVWCSEDEVHALYQSGPPCNCDLRSIVNLTYPGGVGGRGSLTYTVGHSGTACRLSIHTASGRQTQHFI